VDSSSPPMLPHPLSFSCTRATFHISWFVACASFITPGLAARHPTRRWMTVLLLLPQALNATLRTRALLPTDCVNRNVVHHIEPHIVYRRVTLDSGTTASCRGCIGYVACTHTHHSWCWCGAVAPRPPDRSHPLSHTLSLSLPPSCPIRVLTHATHALLPVPSPYTPTLQPSNPPTLQPSNPPTLQPSNPPISSPPTPFTPCSCSQTSWCGSSAPTFTPPSPSPSSTASCTSAKPSGPPHQRTHARTSKLAWPCAPCHSPPCKPCCAPRHWAWRACASSPKPRGCAPSWTCRCATPSWLVSGSTPGVPRRVLDPSTPPPLLPRSMPSSLTSDGRVAVGGGGGDGASGTEGATRGTRGVCKARPTRVPRRGGGAVVDPPATAAAAAAAAVAWAWGWWRRWEWRWGCRKRRQRGSRHRDCAGASDRAPHVVAVRRCRRRLRRPLLLRQPLLLRGYRRRRHHRHRHRCRCRSTASTQPVRGVPAVRAALMMVRPWCALARSAFRSAVRSGWRLP